MGSSLSSLWEHQDPSATNDRNPKPRVESVLIRQKHNENHNRKKRKNFWSKKHTFYQDAKSYFDVDDDFEEEYPVISDAQTSHLEDGSEKGVDNEFGENDAYGCHANGHHANGHHTDGHHAAEASSEDAANQNGENIFLNPDAESFERQPALPEVVFRRRRMIDGKFRENNGSSKKADRNKNNDNTWSEDVASSSSLSAESKAPPAITESHIRLVKAPPAITESHIRLVKLRILLFEIGGGILETEMEKCVRRHGFAGWKEWLGQHEQEVKRYQFYRQIHRIVLPLPDPASWDITFLAFLSKSHALDFPREKREAADKIRQFRNTLSHDLKASVDENTFEDLWGSISSCLLSLTDNLKHVERDIDLVRCLQVETGKNQQDGQNQQPEQCAERKCVCGGTRCDLAAESKNNNHEKEGFSLDIRLLCWRCGIPRIYKMALTDNSSLSIDLE